MEGPQIRPGTAAGCGWPGVSTGAGLAALANGLAVGGKGKTDSPSMRSSAHVVGDTTQAVSCNLHK